MKTLTRNEANLFLALILVTAAEVPGGAPEGPMYAALMGRLDLESFTGLCSLAASMGLVTRSGHVMRITTKGRELVGKIQSTRGVVGVPS